MDVPSSEPQQKRRQNEDAAKSLAITVGVATIWRLRTHTMQTRVASSHMFQGEKGSRHYCFIAMSMHFLERLNTHLHISLHASFILPHHDSSTLITFQPLAHTMHTCLKTKASTRTYIPPSPQCDRNFKH